MTNQNDTYGDDTEHTHYCEDCEMGLALLYDERESTETPIVCGHCGGNNTRALQTDTQRGDEK